MISTSHIILCNVLLREYRKTLYDAIMLVYILTYIFFFLYKTMDGNNDGLLEKVRIYINIFTMYRVD